MTLQELPCILNKKKVCKIIKKVLITVIVLSFSVKLVLTEKKFKN